jgi:hypothetical protein
VLRGPDPPRTRPREDHPHRHLPAHRRCLDQHGDAARAARPQAPPRRRYPRHSHPARPGPHAPPAPAPVRHHTGRTAVPRHPRGILSESVYGRAWHVARLAALGPELAATSLALRPYDLRHAALSLWLNATNAPAEVAARAGNSARVLHDTYLHCIDTHQDLVSQRIEDALDVDLGSRPPSQCGRASGYTHRRHHPRPCPLYVREPAPGPAHSPRPPGPAAPRYRTQATAPTGVSAAQITCEEVAAEARRSPDPAHA